MPKKKSIFKESSSLIKGKTLEKLLNLKQNPRFAALLFVEFVLTIILVGAIILYLDGRFNTIEFPLFSTLNPNSLSLSFTLFEVV